jgi:hypothetical protein
MNWSQKVGGCGDASGVRNAVRGTADVTLWIRGCDAGPERVPGVEKSRTVALQSSPLNTVPTTSHTLFLGHPHLS